VNLKIYNSDDDDSDDYYYCDDALDCDALGTTHLWKHAFPASYQQNTCHDLLVCLVSRVNQSVE
jgi:hypothetical protein